MFRHQLSINPYINLNPLVNDANLELFERIKKDLNHYKIQSLFIESCRKGALMIAKELLKSNSNIDIHAKDEAAFRSACHNGHLEIAQWLLQLAQNVADATSLRSAHYVRTFGISFYKFIGTGERSEL